MGWPASLSQAGQAVYDTEADGLRPRGLRGASSGGTEQIEYQCIRASWFAALFISCSLEETSKVDSTDSIIAKAARTANSMSMSLRIRPASASAAWTSTIQPSNAS